MRKSQHIHLSVLLSQQKVQDRTDKFHADYGYDDPQKAAPPLVGIVGENVPQGYKEQGKLGNDQGKQEGQYFSNIA